MSTGREFAPQFYIRIFSRGNGEMNPNNVISIKTSHNLNSPAGSFSIELDYRESGFGALDSFFRIEPMDFVEIYMRREPGYIGRWTEVRQLVTGNYTEFGKKNLARDKNGAWTTIKNTDKTEYTSSSVNVKDIYGIDFFNSNFTPEREVFKDGSIDDKGLKDVIQKNITIANLNFLRNKPLTFSERIYNPDLVMVGFVDKITNNFGLTENGTQNSITIEGRTVSKFLQLHAITQEVTKLVLGHTDTDKKDLNNTKKTQLLNRGIPGDIINLMIGLLNLNRLRYTRLVNETPNGAAWKIFEYYVAQILGNTKPNDSNWETVGDSLTVSNYNISLDPNALNKNLKKDGIDDDFLKIYDEKYIELENPEIDIDNSANNSNLELVKSQEELQARSGYSISNKDNTMATLHFFDAPWTYIYTSFNIDSSLDPYSRIATEVGPRGGKDWSNPGIGNGVFFSPILGILQRLGNGNINEVFIDEKGFLTLRRRINAFDQTRFLKTENNSILNLSRNETSSCYVDKKYAAYKGLEETYNRIIIKDREIKNWKFNRSDENIKTIVMIRPTMLANGGTTAYYRGWRTTMPQTFKNIVDNINFESDTTHGKIDENDLIKQNIAHDIPRGLIELQGLKSIGDYLKTKALDTLYRNKFSSLFSPPIRTEFQIMNFWQRYGFRSQVVEDFFSLNSSQAQLTAIEIFEKYNNSWWNGEITLQGDPRFRVGKVVELPDIPAKFYCFSVSHNFIWGEQYTTTIGVMMGKIIKTPTNESKNGKRSNYADTALNYLI